MHELSIAMNLIELAEGAARSAHAERVNVVRLRLGVFAGVVKEALLFGYDIAARGTLLEDSLLEIEEVPLVIYCPQCDHKSELGSVQSLWCPHCGHHDTEICQGQELELTSMEIVEHENETA